jgi:hypothetical protein
VNSSSAVSRPAEYEQRSAEDQQHAGAEDEPGDRYAGHRQRLS